MARPKSLSVLLVLHYVRITVSEQKNDVALAFKVSLGDTAQAEISCFHDYGQELALSLLYYLEIGRNHRQK